MLCKSTLVLAFLLFISVFSFGQDPLDNFWKDVERRKNLKKDALADQGSRYDSIIVRDAGNKIFIVEQAYVYEKKNKRYVKGADDFYGVSYGVGVGFSNGILTSTHLQYPW